MSITKGEKRGQIGRAKWSKKGPRKSILRTFDEMIYSVFLEEFNKINPYKIRT